MKCTLFQLKRLHLVPGHAGTFSPDSDIFLCGVQQDRLFIRLAEDSGDLPLAVNLRVLFLDLLFRLGQLHRLQGRLLPLLLRQVLHLLGDLVALVDGISGRKSQKNGKYA